MPCRRAINVEFRTSSRVDATRTRRDTAHQRRWRAGALLARLKSNQRKRTASVSVSTTRSVCLIRLVASYPPPPSSSRRGRSTAEPGARGKRSASTPPSASPRGESPQQHVVPHVNLRRDARSVRDANLTLRGDDRCHRQPGSDICHRLQRRFSIGPAATCHGHEREPNTTDAAARPMATPSQRAQDSGLARQATPALPVRLCAAACP